MCREFEKFTNIMKMLTTIKKINNGNPNNWQMFANILFCFSQKNFFVNGKVRSTFDKWRDKWEKKRLINFIK